MNMKKELSEMAGVLGRSVSIKGELVSDNTLRFDGFIEGTLVSKGVLVVGPEGFVKGKVVGRQITMAGRVEGEVYALERMEILEGADVQGAVFGTVISIQDGAILGGECHLGEMCGDKIKEERQKLKL